jgi:hypothetical protein
MIGLLQYVSVLAVVYGVASLVLSLRGARDHDGLPRPWKMSNEELWDSPEERELMEQEA